MKKLSKIWKNTKRLTKSIIYNSYHNNFLYIDSIPLSTWWKARKVFAKPKLEYYFFKRNSYVYVKDLNPYSHSIINIYDFEWKTKYGDYRFEYCPQIVIKIFGYYFIMIWTDPSGKGDNMNYYETLMNYLWEYKCDIEKTKRCFGVQCLEIDENNEEIWTSCWNDKWLK
jgi:hypothetical protein